jgi:hypothetical protein
MKALTREWMERRFTESDGLGYQGSSRGGKTEGEKSNTSDSESIELL